MGLYEGYVDVWSRLTRDEGDELRALRTQISTARVPAAVPDDVLARAELLSMKMWRVCPGSSAERATAS